MIVSKPEQSPKPTDTVTERHKRAAIVVSLSLSIAMVLSAVFSFVEYLSDPAELFQTMLISLLALYSVIGFMFARANKVIRSAMLIIVSQLVLIPLYIVQIEGIGFLVGGFAIILPISVASLVLPSKYFRSVLIAAVFAGVFAIIGDLYWPFERQATAPTINNYAAIGVAFVALIVIGFIIARNFSSYSLSTKLITGTTILVAVAVISIGLAISRLSGTALEERSGENLQTIAQAQALAVGELLFRETATLRTMALNGQLIQAVQLQNGQYSGDESADLANIEQLDVQWQAAEEDDALITAVLQNSSTPELLQYQDVFPNNVEIFLTDRYGALVASTNRTSDYYQADETWWQVAYNDGLGDFYIGEPEFDESSGVNAINLAVAVKNETNETVGILRTTINLAALEDVLVSARFGDTGQVDIYSPGQFEIELEDEQLVIERDDMLAAEVLFESQASPAGYTFISYDQEPSVLATAPIQTLTHEPVVDALNWLVAVHQTQEEALSGVEAQRRLNILLGNVVLLVAAGFAYVVGQRLTAPILDLTDVAQRVTAGDLSARAAIQSQDEIGTLAKAFNTMTAQVSDAIGTLEDRVQARTQVLETSIEVGRRISTILDTQHLVSEVVSQIRQAFNYYHIHIYLIDSQDETRLRMVGGTGTAGQEMLDSGHTLSLGKGLVGQAALIHQSVWVPDVTQVADWLPNHLLPETKAEVAVPIMQGNQILGVLDVQHNVLNGLQQDDVDLLELIASQVAIALQNAQSYEQAQLKVDREIRFNQINRAIQSTTDVETAMQVTIRELGRVLDAKQIQVQLQSSQNGRNHQGKNE